MKTANPIASTWSNTGAVKYFETLEALQIHLAGAESFAAANLDGQPQRITNQSGKLVFSKWNGLFKRGQENWLPNYPA